jgi:hypothetical protein
MMSRKGRAAFPLAATNPSSLSSPFAKLVLRFREISK